MPLRLKLPHRGPSGAAESDEVNRPEDATTAEVTEKGSRWRPRRANRSDVLCTILAVLAAVVAVLVARGVFGWGSGFGTALLAYAAFVGALVATQIAEKRRVAQLAAVAAPPSRTPASRIPAFDDTQEVDLVAAERELGAVGEMEDELEEDRPPSEDRPIRRRRFTKRDLVELVLVAAAAAAIAGIIRTIWDVQSPTGTVIWGFLAFLVIYYVVVRDRADAETALDKIVTVILCAIALIVVGVLAWMLVYLVSQGLPKLAASFFTEDLSQVGPLTPGGGAKHAIIGTIEQVAIATIVVVPVAILTAVYLHELKGRMARPVRFITDAMSGLPSIVAGLLVFTIWVSGRGFSGVAASMALAVLMLPTVTRTSEEMLRTIPDSLREASMALGAPQWRVVMRVVVPTARAGLVTAAILGVARAIGETAPVLLTALGTDSTNTNPLKDPQSDLPLFVWKLIRVPNSTQVQRAWTGMLILVMLVLVLFVTARFISNRSQRKLGRSR
jgi:phosphate transport system permease protein